MTPVVELGLVARATSDVRVLLWRGPARQRRFDDVFDEGVGNEELYQRAIQPLIATIFKCERRAARGLRAVAVPRR